MNSPNKAYSKLKWTQEEEQLLRTLKQQKNIDSWKTIANQMNQIFVEKNRSGKQCRERYMNYVRFGSNTPKTFGWTQSEDQELFEKFMQHGAKWVQIGKQMQGRSENCLKNRFYGAMRKIIRKINRTAKQKKLRQKKPIKADLLIRILQYQFKGKDENVNQQQKVSEFLDGLKKQMIKIAINPQQNSCSEQIQSLISGIIKFCGLAKSSGMRRQSEKISLEQQEAEVDEQNQQFEECESKIYGSKQILEQAGTLVENKLSSQEPEKKSSHKIVQNFILVNSVEMKHPHQNPKIGLDLFLGCSHEIIRNQQEKHKCLNS